MAIKLSEIYKVVDAMMPIASYENLSDTNIYSRNISIDVMGFLNLRGIRVIDDMGEREYNPAVVVRDQAKARLEKILWRR